MNDMTGEKYKYVLPHDGSASRRERILHHDEFAQKMVSLIHFLYADQPDTIDSLLRHFSDDELKMIQDKHQFTDEAMIDSFTPR